MGNATTASSLSLTATATRAWRRTDVLAASVCLNLLALAMPLVVLQLYDRIIPQQAVETLALLTSALIVITAIETGLRIARSKLLNLQGARYEHDAMMQAIDRLLGMELVAFEAHAKGSYLDQFDAISQTRDFYHGNTMLTMVDMPFGLLFLGLIWTFAGSLVLIPVAIVTIFTLVSIIAGRRLQAAITEQDTQLERRRNFLIEVLQSIHTVKASTMEKQIQRRYERLQGSAAQAVYTLTTTNSMVTGIGATFSQAVMVLFVSVGSVSAINGEISVGALAASTMLAGRVLQPALGAMSFWTQRQSIELAREKLEKFMALPMEGLYGKQPLKMRGGVTLRDVSFKHPWMDGDLIDGVNLEVAPGEAIAISGESGSGKSTLLDLMMGFTHRDGGEILFDGQNLDALEKSNLRSQIGLVPQNGILFNGTLLENMTLFREGEAISEALQLARMIGLDEFITRLPDGLETQYHSGAQGTLPDGLRQRLVMVRALIGRPKLILFDDADSGLDAEAQLQAVEMLFRLRDEGATLIIVSNRSYVLMRCDRQLTLANGKLYESDGFGGMVPAELLGGDPAPAGASPDDADALGSESA
ncbi:MAG: ATP-binding cassette domain-containing protein [Pseudomonadota bacterium]